MNTTTSDCGEKANKRKSIEELFENYNGDYEPTEIDWGYPQGKEVV